MTLPSSMRGIGIMSDSYLGLYIKENLKNRPEDFIINEDEVNAKIAKTLKACQALQAKNATAKSDPKQPLREEYNKLVNDHFNLKQWVRSCETRVNESAGQIRNDEQRLNSLLIQKTKMESPTGQRTIENAIVRVEDEIAEEKTKYNKLRTENLNAVKALKAFDGARMTALKAELDAPPPKL